MNGMISSKRKSGFALLAVILLLAALTVSGCGQSAKPSENNVPTVTLTAGHAVNETHPYHLGLQKFAELVSEKTNGSVNVDIYPSGQLGSERDMVEGLQLGTLDIVVTSTGPIGSFVPLMSVVDLPFLFRNAEHADKVLDGEVGQQLLAGFEGSKIVGLAFWENGFRHLTNSRQPVTSPADVKNLKIRTMENRVHLETFRVLEADPTPMAWGEVFTALQQKVIDGQENPIPIIYNLNVYEVQSHLALTGHFYSPALILFSEQSFEKLTQEQQNAVRDAAREAAVYQREQIRSQENEQLDKLRELEIQITEPDRNAFLEATKPVYEKFEGEFGKDLIEKILNTN